MAAAASGPPPPDRTKVQKKKTPEKVIITLGYTKINQELIVRLSAPVPASISNDPILLAANTAITPDNI